ncbi:hypothetical protein [Clostridium tagluense]|uniref:hypothetical protein n=1 Tax=Clostridium tagluense TaxID=360422 RepID=UPI001C0CA5AE|nr:hypothetical protein [Clostridium tagluense]MBU3129013.1 hypothetical protein [Clostridium tagluense]
MQNLAKKSSIASVLEDMNFTDKEKEVFLASIQLTKNAQKDDSINASFEMDKLIREMISNEI